MGAMFLTTVVVIHFSLSLSISAQNVNPVTQPIINSNQYVHTKTVAKIPDELGKPARINSITHYGGFLYVVTLLRIWRLRPDGGELTLFLDVQEAIKEHTDRELSTENIVHGGVRSVAFHPVSLLFYLSVMEKRPAEPAQFRYISDVPDHVDADSALLEYQLDAYGNAVPSSYRCVLRVGVPKIDHTIRYIAFHGPLLYIAHGDADEQDATAGGGQNNDARGKILRIDPLHTTYGSYQVPSSNPFYGANYGMPDEVWALGFRNPHHICFGKDGTLYVAEAGRSNVEEVNLVEKGGNYGWSEREGTFQHNGGRLVSGVDPLPDDDEKYNYTYPNAQVGHEGPLNSGNLGQAIAGGCPVENGSPMSGLYYYSNFPISGKLYFSRIDKLKTAVVKGSPSSLTQARTFESKLCFDDDGDPDSPSKPFQTLGEVMRSSPEYANSQRVDVRLGQGPSGELYWSSKQNGLLYVFTSSLVGGPKGRC